VYNIYRASFAISRHDCRAYRVHLSLWLSL